MRKAIDLTGQVFGRLTAIRPTEQRISGSVGWLCQCSCEERIEVVVPAKRLRSGETQSCGCLIKEQKGKKNPWIDLTGRQFNNLLVLHDSGKRSNSQILWTCQCTICGATTLVQTHNLKMGYAKSCGCIKKLDLRGKKFGRLTAIKPSLVKKGTQIMWLCECDCGNKNVLVSGSNMVNGATRSCGCLQREARKERIIDLTGQVFGRLTAIRPTEQRVGSSVGWLCRCSCEAHAEVVVSANSLRSGNSKSCGCLNEEARKKTIVDLTGQVFGRLTAIRPTEQRSGSSVKWLCRCSCEAHTEVVVSAGNLRSGGTRSCGCLKRERKKKEDVDVQDHQNENG